MHKQHIQHTINKIHDKNKRIIYNMYDMQNMYYTLIMKNKKTIPKQSILW